MSKTETAVFDFTKVSKQWNLKFGLTLTAVARAEITLKRPAPQGGDYDALQTFYDKQEEALTVIERLASEQAGMVAEVLVLNNPCFTKMRGPKELAEFSLKAGSALDKIWLWSPRLKSFQSRELAPGAAGKVEFSLKKSNFLTIAPPPPATGKPESEYH